MAPNLRTLVAQAHRSIGSRQAARFSSSSPESTAAGEKVVAGGGLKTRFSSSSPGPGVFTCGVLGYFFYVGWEIVELRKQSNQIAEGMKFVSQRYRELVSKAMHDVDR